MHTVLNNITLSSEDRQSYASDANIIKDCIINKMKGDNTFRDYFGGDSLVGSYLDDLKIDLPDEFDICVILRMPFSLTPIKHGAYLHLRTTIASQQLLKQQQADKLMERCTDNYYYVSRVKVQKLIRSILEGIFRNNYVNVTIPQTDRKYKVTYSDKLRGHAVAHTFFAKSLNQNPREISFDFVPSFEFDHNQWVYARKHSSNLKWFAVPSPNNDDELEFNISAPYYERELIKDKHNLKNCLRLLKALKDHNDMTAIQSYVLKTVVLWENEKRPQHFWQKEMGEILIEMIESLLRYMKSGHLPFFWETSINLLDRVIKSHKLHEFEQKFKDILTILKGHESKNLSELFAVFKINA